MPRPNDAAFQQRIKRIEALTQALERSPHDSTRADAQELVHAVLELHGAGFARLVELMAGAGEPGRALIDSSARDELVGSLLLLHDLHPDELPVRVERALESVRPSLRSHGGEVTLLGVSDGVVRIKMEGSCHGCPSSAATLKNTIEEAVIALAPDIASIEVAGLEPDPPGFVSIGDLKSTLGNGQLAVEPDEAALAGQS